MSVLIETEKKQQSSSQKEKVRLNRFADLIGKSILTIRAQAFSDEAAQKLQRVAHLIMNIYRQDNETVEIMSQMSSALTGKINEEKIKQLEALNLRFRTHIRKG